MAKRILSVLIVLCMALTFVPFASAASIMDGYLMIDSKKAASGNGWSWEDNVLTISSTQDFSSVMLSVEAKVVIENDIELDGSLITAKGGEIVTGDYTLTIGGAISGEELSIYNSTVNVRGVTVSGDLNIINSTLISDCNGMSYSFGIYAGRLCVENSAVYSSSSMDEDTELMGIISNEITVTDSIIKAYGNVYGIMVSKASGEYTGKIEINNSSVYAKGGVVGMATSYTYQNDTVVFDAFVINDSNGITPESATVVEDSYTNSYGSVMKYAAIADIYGEVALEVELEAADKTKLPVEPEFPDAPELPTTPEEPEEPEMTEAIYQEFWGDELNITIITYGDFDRVALFYADSTDLKDCLMTANDCIDYENGFRQWMFTIDAPTKTTQFVIKARDTETQSYKNGKEYAFTIVPPYIEPILDELYVGGVDAFETPEGDGWYFDESTRTLTLDNCTLTQTGTYLDGDGYPITAVIFARGDLIINIIGDNFVEATITEIPETYTTYGGIWVDSSYNNYEADTLVITGSGHLTAGVAIAQEVYRTGLVEFSFGVYVFSDFGVDFSELDANSSVDFYGGVIGIPATYNVRALSIAPTYMPGTVIESYRDIECTMPEENGYDPINNEVWRFKATVPNAYVDELGILNINSTQPAVGNGWTWKDGILTINSEVDFKAVYIALYDADVRVVVTEDVTIDTRITADEELSYSFPSLSLYAIGGNIEIETGDNVLTLLNDRGTVIDAYGTVTLNGNLVVDTCGSGWDACFVNGDLIVNNSSIYCENGGVVAYSIFDYETEKDICGNIVLNNSSVFMSTITDSGMEYLTAIEAYGELEIDNSYVMAIGEYAGIMAKYISIKNSTVSAYGNSVGIESYYTFSVDNSELSVESSCVAISVAPDSFHGEIIEADLDLKGVAFFAPESYTIGVAEVVDEYGYSYFTTTIIDENGDAATSVWAYAGNYAEYEIINGKLIITVVTESRINRVALYDADGKCIKTFNTYEVNEWGEYVWTIKMDAPTEEVQYIIKGRDAEANSYKAGFTLPALTVEPEVVFESVEVETRGDKVYVIATTVSDNYDRVAIVNPVDGSYVKYTRNFEYDFENEVYVWTIFFDYVEGMDNLIVKARDIRNNRYNNAQAVDITVEAPVEPVIDVTITDYDEAHILVTVTTIPDLYRVKIAYADNATSNIAYARNPVTKADDAWTWEMIIDRPAETIEYAVDVAYVKAYARYFTYVTYTAEA